MLEALTNWFYGPKTKYETESNKVWHNFGDSLKASKEYCSIGLQQCQTICTSFQQLAKQTKPGFSIASIYYGGSVGKKTDVKKPDFDIVMKLNGIKPPFEVVLEWMYDCLKKNALNFQIDPETFVLSPYSVQFTFYNGMEVDLLPAVNLEALQVFLLLRKMPYSEGRYYYSSLVESQVGFMRSQDAFTHNIARLAKYWLKSMENINGHISGGSFIFELLAVAACRKEREERPENARSNVRAFRQVVDAVARLDEAEFYFEWENQPVNREELQDLIEDHSVPFILDPSNPMNNLLSKMKWGVMQTLMKNGRVMQARLDEIVDNEIIYVDFETFFRH